MSNNIKETKLGDKYENTKKPRTMDNPKKKKRKSKMSPSGVGYGIQHGGTPGKHTGGGGSGGPIN